MGNSSPFRSPVLMKWQDSEVGFIFWILKNWKEKQKGLNLKSKINLTKAYKWIAKNISLHPNFSRATFWSNNETLKN